MTKSKRGFALMDQEKRRAISRKGGQAAHAKGAAHEFTSKEAREAGRKGGEAVSKDRAYMAMIGRRGGIKTPGHRQPRRDRETLTDQEQSPPTAGNMANRHQSSPEAEDTANRQWSPYGAEDTTNNAAAMLKADHEKVESLFHAFEMANGQSIQKEAIARQVFRELQIHTALEEEIFYPAVQAKVGQEGKELVTEGLKEHRTAKDLINQLTGLSPEDPTYDMTFWKLMEGVRHHVQKEEAEMLPEAEATLGHELERLGAEMQERKLHMTSGQVRLPEQQYPQSVNS